MAKTTVADCLADSDLLTRQIGALYLKRDGLESQIADINGEIARLKVQLANRGALMEVLQRDEASHG